MHRVLILGGDKDLHQRIENLLAEVGNISGIAALTKMPGEIELARILQTGRPELVMVVVTSMLAVADFMRNMDLSAPGSAVLALSPYTDPRTVRELAQAGIREIIQVPFVRGAFVETVNRAIAGLRRTPPVEPMPQLFSFLPGKGGSGTSRLACHFAMSLASVAEQNEGSRVLLLDLDFSSGLSRYLFERRHCHTLVEMIEAGVPLDGTYWNQFIARYGALDVVHGGATNPRHPVSPSKIKQLLDTAGTRYEAICADLTGNSEAFSIEVLRRSNRIFLVASSDPGALQLSQARVQFLEQIGLGRRVNVLLSRFNQQDTMPPARVATEIGAPVVAEFNFNERDLLETISKGRPFDGKAPIARHIQRSAQKLIWEITRTAQSRNQSITL